MIEYDQLKIGRKYRITLDTPVGMVQLDGVLMKEDGYQYEVVAIGEVVIDTNGLHGVKFEEVKINE